MQLEPWNTAMSFTATDLSVIPLMTSTQTNSAVTSIQNGADRCSSRDGYYAIPDTFHDQRNMPNSYLCKRHRINS